MKLNLFSAQPDQPTPVMVCLVAENALDQQLQCLDLNLDLTQVKTWLEASQFEAKLAESHCLVQQSSTANVLYLMGVGQLETLALNKLAKLAQSIIKPLQKKYQQVVIDVGVLPTEFHAPFLAALIQANYSFDTLKSTANDIQLQTISLKNLSDTVTEQQLQFIEAVGAGQYFTRTLGNMPGNICYPEYLAEQAVALAAQYPDRLKVTVLDQTQMAELGMNAFLAVSQGSQRPGRLVLLQYCAELETQPIALVGKGVTFDTGGISIKPALGMDEMKFDMCGAATVLGVMKALCESGLQRSVVGALACAENMPSGGATRPGDVVTTLSGQTVEILNTDAEGRLVLCDTLTYIERFKPSVVIDIATLTGACVVALGKVVSGLFSNDQALANQLIQAGEQSGDRVWQMPLLDDYQELLDSTIADMGNIGGPTGGAITAACFLKRFCEDYRWAHLDIAGTAWLSGTQKGATGRPVPLLMQFLSDYQN